jgi:hypothetical protein
MQYIGYAGAGTFTQTGGNNTAANLMMAGSSGSSGIYNLQGGALSAGAIQVNPGGTFNQTGGILNFTTFNQKGGTVARSLENRGDLQLQQRYLQWPPAELRRSLF